jgi:ParB/RepB/Spo0J family partition protein
MQGNLESLPIKKVLPTPDNPRRVLPTDPAVVELSESIRAHGLLQPVLARPHPKRKGFYDLRAGARRLAAAKLADLAEIPAFVRDMTDQEALEVTVVENLLREELSPLEEASGVQLCLDRGWTAAVIADHIGKTPSWVLRRARLTKLSATWRKRIEDPGEPFSDWPAAHLELVARLDPDVQDLLLKKTHAWRWYRDGKMTTGQLERIIGDFTRELRKAPWRLDDVALVEEAGACCDCLKRSSARPGLFDEIDMDDPKEAKRDQCLDPRCWSRKAIAYTKAKAEDLQEKHGAVIFVQDHLHGEACDPKMEKDSVSEWQVNRSKKDVQGAKPCLVISGPRAGTWFWGRRGGSSPDLAGSVKGKGKAVEDKGDPDRRRRMAAHFAAAHVAVVAVASEWMRSWYSPLNILGRLPGSEKNGLSQALLSVVKHYILESEGRGLYGRHFAAVDWMRKSLGMPQTKQADVRTASGSDFDLVDADPEELETLIGSDVAANIDRVMAFGIYDALLDVWFEKGILTSGQVEISPHQIATAGEGFRVPRLFLESHQKADLLIIARELDVETVKPSMRVADVVDAILDADLPAGSLTKDLAGVFGREYAERPKVRKSSSRRSTSKAKPKRKK